MPQILHSMTHFASLLLFLSVMLVIAVESHETTRWVVISVDDNAQYSFFVPLTVRRWEALGYRTIVFWSGSDPSLLRTMEVAKQFGAYTHELPLKPEYGTSWWQTSRLFGALLPTVDAEDFLLTSDADIWPVKDNYFDLDANVLNWLGWPYPRMCYIGAKAKMWKEMLDIKKDEEGNVEKALVSRLSDYGKAVDWWSPKLSEKERLALQWGADQEILEQYLLQFTENEKNVNLLNCSPRDLQIEIDRIDRLYDDDWKADYPIENVIDAHVCLNNSLPKHVDADGYQWWRWVRTLWGRIMPNDNWVDEWFMEFDRMSDKQLFPKWERLQSTDSHRIQAEKQHIDQPPSTAFIESI